MNAPRPSARLASSALRVLSDPKDAAFLQRFFKTGKGEYGEGDRFLGIRVPDVRKVARDFSGLPLSDCEKLLASPYNEERLLALVVLSNRFKKAPQERAAIARLYLRSLRRVNNWNLVDTSAPDILGAWLEDRSRTPLRKLARSRSLWDRRVAILSTFHFIRAGEFSDTLDLTRLLLNDPEDLMHKACGWMLREIGKRDSRALETFLRKHCREMPRTMLRYAIERLPEAKRQAYLKGKVR